MECGDASPLCSAVTRHGGKSADTSAHSKSMYHSAMRHPVQITCSLAWHSMHYVHHHFRIREAWKPARHLPETSTQTRSPALFLQ